MSYTDDLGTVNLNIAAIKNIIKEAMLGHIALTESGRVHDTMLPFHIIGPAGTGKTQICNQIANELGQELNIPFNFIRIIGPTLFRDDFIVPFPKMDSDEDGHRRFEMLYSDIMPRPDQEYGIFMIDEFSRADHQVQQMLWQLMNEGKLHTYGFSKNWFIIIADNPDDENYSMNNLTDAAGMRRSAKYGVMVDNKTWIDHAIEHDFHQAVIGYISAHPDALYDTQAMGKQMIYSNPATWERVSDLLYGYELRNINLLSDTVIMTLAGMLNITGATQFKEFLADRFVSAEEVICINDDKVKKKLARLVKANDQMALSSTMSMCLTYFEKSEKTKLDPKDKEFINFQEFVLSVPADIACLIMAKANESSKTGNSNCMNLIHSMILQFMQNETFRKNVHQPMVDANNMSKFVS